MTSLDPLLTAPALLRLAGLAMLIALLPLGWWWLRQRRASWRGRLAALTVLTLFLTFDLIVVGSFTRLTDSGLGCPDWPGCYGQASPIGAAAPIAAEQAALPSGPVTHAKAWIEMLHRYLAMAVGLLILLATLIAWRARRELPLSPWWSTLTLAWVIAQGLFGKYTVTLKLYPAVVTGHLLGALGLLALLVLQVRWLQGQAIRATDSTATASPLPSRRAAVWVAVVAALVLMQIALGGWVSSNYAVLACQGFPGCSGQWWPTMDFAQGFTLLRELGRTAQSGPGAAAVYLPFEALVAIHMAHRLMAVVALAALAALALWLWRTGHAGLRQHGAWLAGLLIWQAASGLSNVVLGWPLVAALAHSAGAAGLVAVLVSAFAALRAGPRAATTAVGLSKFPARSPDLAGTLAAGSRVS